ncbi:MAG: hypothetical protein ACI8ZM_002427 [Crocinitomix sp.]|jgi:hypothetical protein
MLNKIGFTLLAIFCIQSVVYCIEDDSLKRKTEFGFALGGDYCYRSLTTNANEFTTADFYINRRQFGEIRKFGLGIEVTISKPLGTRFNLISGIHFRERGFLRKEAFWSDLSGVSFIGLADVNYQLSFIGIPVKLEYIKNYNRFSFFANGGVGLEYLVRNKMKVDIDFYNSETKATEIFERGERIVPWYPAELEQNANKFMLTGLLELGIAISLSDRANLRLAPNASYSISSLLPTPINERLWSVGFKAGIYFKF